MTRIRRDQSVKAQVLKRLASGDTSTLISKEMKIPLSTLSQWRKKAGLGKYKHNRLKRHPVRAAKISRTKMIIRNPLHVITSLVTDPALNNNQRVRMIMAYLNEQ